MIKTALLLYLSAICLVSAAQSPQVDTMYVSIAAKNATEQYKQIIKGQAHLYNGGEYVEPRRTNETHPFFDSDDWVTGSVTYDNDRYENVPLMFDIYSEKLITESYYGHEEIALVNQKIQRFNIGNHYFERIEQDSLKVLQPGLYEILYSGNTRALVKRRKDLQEELEAQKVEYYYEPKNSYYIEKHNVFHHVKSKGSIFKVLEDRKSELKQFLKKSKLRFKSNREESLSKLVSYYDSITTPK